MSRNEILATADGVSTGMDGAVYGMAIDHNGNVYACVHKGNNGIDGNSHCAVEWRWRWNRDTTGIFNEVSALAVDSNGHLFANGYHYIITFYTPNIAEWDGTAWRVIGSGVWYTNALDGRCERHAGIAAAI